MEQITMIERTQYRKCCEIILDKMDELLEDETIKEMFNASVNIFVNELEIALFGKESEV
jgi:hypothetical protein